MQPYGKLRKDMMRKFRIFPGEDHPFTDVELVPFEMPPRILRKKNVPDVFLPEGFQPMNPEGFEQNKRLAAKSNAARDAWHARLAAAEAMKRELD